jgi:Secretion system C-terminal sorting domain
MKHFSIFLFFVFNVTLAQVYVSDNSFIYNRSSLVFVTGNVELNGTNSNFYLRNEGQLLQGTTGTSANRGVGKLSVFQEGSSDNFDYNYWCSPVGNASAAVGNENFGIAMLNRPTTLTASTPVTITSAFDGTTSNTTLDISKRWIWKYLSSNVYDPGGAGWIYVQDTPTLAAGQGFTMKGTSGTDNTNVGELTLNNPGGAQRYDFRGKPNDGNITVGVDLNKMTLTGNPYPSALHVNAFLLDPANTAFDRTAYYWEHDKTVNSHNLAQYRGGYGTYSPISLVSNGLYVPATFNTYNNDGTLNTTGASSGLSIERKYAPIGQGFMIKGNALGTVTLKNAHREYYQEVGALSQFERMENAATDAPTTGVGAINTVSHIRLNTVLNNQFTRQMALAFIPEATMGVDPGIDSESPDGDGLPNDAYFFINNDRYVIEGINFSIEKRVPLGVKVTGNSTFKFNLLEVVNFDDNQPVYIFDAETNLYHNLKLADFTVNLSEGTYNNRFQVTFMDGSLSTTNIISNNLAVVQNNVSQLLSISNPNALELKSAVLYDMAGKLIIEKSDLESKINYEISTSILSEGVYIVKIVAKDGQTMSQKIIVERKN